MPLKVKLCSFLVDDQSRALDFYTNKLGFIKKQDIGMEEAKWLTVVSTDSDYVVLLFEPKIALEEPKTYAKALKDPAAAFEVKDINKEYSMNNENLRGWNLNQNQRMELIGH